MREKIILGGFEQWVEYHVKSSDIRIYGFETAKCPLIIDVMGGKENPYVTDNILTDQEKQEIKNYLKNYKIN